MSGRNRHWYAQLATMSLAPVAEFRSFARRTRGFKFTNEHTARICQMKLRVALPEVSKGDKEAARVWLTAHGYSHDITFGPFP